MMQSNKGCFRGSNVGNYSIHGAFRIPYRFRPGKNRTRSEIAGYFDYFDCWRVKTQPLKNLVGGNRVLFGGNLWTYMDVGGIYDWFQPITRQLSLFFYLKFGALEVHFVLGNACKQEL